MKLPPILRKIHEKVTKNMSRSWFVENVLIATVNGDDGEYDCIYCTIVRTALFFACVGFVLGVIIGVFL